MNTPEWMKFREDKPGVVECDPDGFYPAYLQEFADAGEFTVEVQRAPNGPSEQVALKYEGEPDQYWLEIAFNFMKLDTSFWASLLKAKLIERRVVGAAEHKARWTQAGKPPGRYADIEARFGKRQPGAGAISPADSQVRREARAIYRKLRGVLPSMA